MVVIMIGRKRSAQALKIACSELGPSLRSAAIAKIRLSYRKFETVRILPESLLHFQHHVIVIQLGVHTDTLPGERKLPQMRPVEVRLPGEKCKLLRQPVREPP
jgi:hypothetical protein